MAHTQASSKKEKWREEESLFSMIDPFMMESTRTTKSMVQANTQKMAKFTKVSGKAV